MKKIQSAVLLAAIAATAAGCRIQVSTTAGGSVSTLSGSYSCNPGESCAEVSVIDTNFDETFVATPQAGFQFDGWRRRNRGFCGGSMSDCRLFTSGFVGNDILLAFLNNPDELFFLEAVFSATSSGGSGDGSASSCFNPDFYAPGTTFVFTQNEVDDEGQRFTSEGQGVVESGATFNGQTANVLAVDQTLNPDDGSGLITAESRTYFRLDGMSYQEFGIEFFATAPDAFGLRNTFDPFREERFSLMPGQSFEQSIEQTTETLDGAGNTLLSGTINTIETITFNGVETVTVPAGTFEACKFTESTRQAGIPISFESFTWYSVGSGFPIKSESDDESTELVSGSINGVDI
ncbi:MAG: hypothetical protein AAF662_14075 [Pseudomonadota bacterium]